MSREQVLDFSIEDRHAVIIIDDPEPLRIPLILPPNEKRVREVSLPFLDIDPEEYHDKRDKLVEVYNKPHTSLTATKEHGRMMWRTLLKKDGNSPPSAIVIADNNDRRGISVACAICDVLGLPRGTVEKMEQPGTDISKKGEAPNRWVYDTFKSSRLMLVD